MSKTASEGFDDRGANLSMPIVSRAFEQLEKDRRASSGFMIASNVENVLTNKVNMCQRKSRF
jgi:hypothetical protein